MRQPSFPFKPAIAADPKPKPPTSILQVKVVAQTLKEVSKSYGAMEHPAQLVEFWRQEIGSTDWFDSEKEHLVVVCLDAKLMIKVFNLVSVGLSNQTLIHAREVFRPAVSVAAAQAILVHNHPSGDPKPSADDIRCTREMAEAGRILGIPLLDHVIVGKPSDLNPSGFVSLKQMGVVGG